MGHTAEKLERSFQVDQAPRISVDMPDGSISVGPGEDGTVKVAIRDRDAEEFEDGEPIVAVQEGNVIRVRWNEEVGESDLALRVTVPRQSSLDVSTREGQISVHGLDGEIRLESDDGEVAAHDLRGTIAIESQQGHVNVHDLNGEMTIECSDGDLAAEGLNGSLRVDCANGDIQIRRSRLTRLSLEAPNGEAEVETSLAGGGEYRLNVTNGDTKLSIPAASQADVRLVTENGEVRCDLPAEVSVRKTKRWEGRLNGGGATVHVESSNGDIRVGAGAGSVAMPEAPTPPSPHATLSPISPIEPFSPAELFSPMEPFETSRSAAAPTPGHNDETVEVLARLERGEISVEEAMSSLDRLG